MKTKTTYLIVFALTFSLLGCNSSVISHKSNSDGWIPLLKGNSLDGWYTYLEEKGVKGTETHQDTDGIFTIQDGILHIYKNAEDGSKVLFGYLATVQEYENYRLRLQFKWGTKKFAPRTKSPRDSGLLYHFVGNDAVWPLSTECQIQEGDTGTVYTVGTTVTSTLAPGTDTYQDTVDGGVKQDKGGSEIKWILLNHDWEVPGWNTVEVIIRGNSAVHIINGKVNNRIWNIRQPDPSNPDELIPMSKGKIILQAEGAEVYFRNVEIKLL